MYEMNLCQFKFAILRTEHCGFYKSCIEFTRRTLWESFFCVLNIRIQINK